MSLEEELLELNNVYQNMKARCEELEQLIYRYHALLDVWDLDTANVPFSIAEAAEQEKMDLQCEAYSLLKGVFPGQNVMIAEKKKEE